MKNSTIIEKIQPENIRRRKRAYHMDVTKPGVGFINWPGAIVHSDSRIREVCFDVFWRVFGLHPTEWWHKDGFMAEAWDARGNRVTLEQLNWEDA